MWFKPGNLHKHISQRPDEVLMPESMEPAHVGDTYLIQVSLEKDLNTKTRNKSITFHPKSKISALHLIITSLKSPDSAGNKGGRSEAVLQDAGTVFPLTSSTCVHMYESAISDVTHSVVCRFALSPCICISTCMQSAQDRCQPIIGEICMRGVSPHHH